MRPTPVPGPLIAFLVLLVATRVGSAKEFEVPTEFGTIQEAVNAANAGDIVVVKPGEYREIVVIPAGKPDITIRGTKQGKVVLDSRIAADGAGAGLRILANGVTVENLVVRHAASTAGVGPESEGLGVLVLADDVRLEGLDLFHCEDEGVHVDGARVVVKKCTVRGARFGVMITGDDATVKQCSIDQIDEDAIVVVGDGARVEQTSVTTAGGHGVAVSGDGAGVRSCEITFTVDEAILIAGQDSWIEQNTVRGIATDATIRATGGPGAIVEKNVCRDSLAPGILMESDGGRVSENLVRDCGGGIRIAADGVDVLDNTVLDTGYDGFNVVGDENFLSGNVSRRNLYDGFEIQGGNDNRLVGNVAKGNHGEGIENDGNQTVVKKNIALGNRTDVANGGALAVFKQNEFVTGGPATPPSIDDD